LEKLRASNGNQPVQSTCPLRRVYRDVSTKPLFIDTFHLYVDVVVESGNAFRLQLSQEDMYLVVPNLVRSAFAFAKGVVPSNGKSDVFVVFIALLHFFCGSSDSIDCAFKVVCVLLSLCCLVSSGLVCGGSWKAQIVY
jgi:hypothetical protein